MFLLTCYDLLKERYLNLRFTTQEKCPRKIASQRKNVFLENCAQKITLQENRPPPQKIALRKIAPHEYVNFFLSLIFYF